VSSETRGKVLKFLQEEIVGPRSEGQPLPMEADLKFADRQAAAGPWVSQTSGEEVLRSRPRERYGAGVLSPQVEPSPIANEETDSPISDELNLDDPSVGIPLVDDLSDQEVKGDEGKTSPADFELRSKRAWRNISSVGISIHIPRTEIGSLGVTITGGVYKPKKVSVIVGKDGSTKSRDEKWFYREPFNFIVEFQAADIAKCIENKKLVGQVISRSHDNPTLEVQLLVRPTKNETYVCTVSCVNTSSGDPDTESVFQVNLVGNTSGNLNFLPYPEASRDFEMDLDDESALLLFKNYPTFAIGHNIGVEWSRGSHKSLDSITASAMPVFETPSITPKVAFADGTQPNLDMFMFSDSNAKLQILVELKKLADEYSKWIDKQEETASEDKEISELYFRSAAQNIEECKLAHKRIVGGIAILETDDRAFQAFSLANRAILQQQVRSKLPTRKTKFKAGQISVEGNYPDFKVDEVGGTWFPFQIAFILSTIESTANLESPDRDLVDLIFFPTGGGKTEAYLGLAAFTILYRRLLNPKDSGTIALMRYTLRLLTTQQFVRAASLICALENIRRESQELLGPEEFSIGAWLGGDVTPNKVEQAVKVIGNLKRHGKSAANQFLVLKCPWCSAEMGPIAENTSSNEKKYFPAGYRIKTQGKKRFEFHCPDIKCEFFSKLPLQVVDECVYLNPPTLVIGTVDKFAQLAWDGSARSIFGIGSDGQRTSSPPSLIIQDEFHLISGPLGSMVGMYEGIIEELCKEEKGGKVIPPKIVSSTATIRRYKAQAKAIFARDRVSLFPPPALDASDSFFAVWDRKEDGQLKDGRLYVGVNAPGLGSIQSAQVRVGAALAQAPMKFVTDAERDPWWTNLWFFNSIRELSNTIPLYTGDIPSYLLDMRKRYGYDTRHLNNVHELTSRRLSHELPKILEELMATYRGISDPSQRGIWDACLASNIIEVGVDISRLSLMTIVSQPKSTAQYIQVSGRVGRRPEVSPGLVVTLYSSNRPRDLSHYEHFRSYHEKLYGQVEPTSVTPFAPPVIKRALRGATVAFVRMVAPLKAAPKEIDVDILKSILNVLRDRAIKIGITQLDLNFLDREISLILKEWEVFSSDEWGSQQGSKNGLLAASNEDPEIEGFRWVIPVSMRNVDQSVELEITQAYRNALMDDEDEVGYGELQ
jgi:hypothetical protein